MNAALIRITSTVVMLVASLLSASAFATPNILGVFTGTFSGTEFNCQPSPPPSPPGTGPFTDTFTLTLTIDDQAGSFFSGTGTTNDNDSVGVSGSISATGQITASFNFTDVDGVFGNGSFSGNLSGDTLSLTIIGADVGGPGTQFCDFQYSGTMTRGASTNNAELTAPTNISTPAELRSFTRNFSQSLTQRFNVFRSGSTGGASAVSNGFMLQSNGMNAGDSLPYPVGVWGSFSRTDSEDESTLRTFKADRNQFLGGADVSPWKDVLVGVALGYEKADVTTPVNGGSQDIDGFTAAPYFAMMFSDIFSADVSFGVSNIDIKQSRVLAGTTLASEVDSLRTFIAGNLNASHSVGSVLFSGHLGALYARDRHDGFTETGGALTIANLARTFKLGQVRFGAEASYLADEFEPFASLTLEHDYTSTAAAGGSNDRNGGVIGVGVRYFGARNGVSANLDYQSVIGRKNLDEGTLGFSLRVNY